MKFRDPKNKKEELNDSKLFFKGLQQKFMNLRVSTNSSMKQSCISQKSKRSQALKYESNLKKKEKAEKKTSEIKNILDISKHNFGQQIEKLKQSYNFDAFIKIYQELADLAIQTIEVTHSKLISIKISPVSEATKTKTQLISVYIEPIIKHFQKATICIYSMGKTQKSQFYDMLSIRRELKTDTKLLVQTNICNNSKSGIIIRKLVDVARERERAMNGQNLIQTVVVKIKGVLYGQKQNINGENKQVELEISSGGYGQLGNKDLMGADRLRCFIHVIQCDEFHAFEQIQKSILQYKKPQKAEDQSELLQKIRILQLELSLKRKQLQQQKIRKAKEQQLEAELQHINLPSERPMINIKKYETKLPKTVLNSRKQSFR